MRRFRVVMKVQGEGPPEADQEVEKIVSAADSEAALRAAKDLVRRENPEINAARIYFWAIWRLPGAGSAQAG